MKYTGSSLVGRATRFPVRMGASFSICSCCQSWDPVSPFVLVFRVRANFPICSCCARSTRTAPLRILGVLICDQAFVGRARARSRSLFIRDLKHGASLYLKFEGLNLSVVIIFKTFHWLKNFESCSVVSKARHQWLLRQRKVILCCWRVPYTFSVTRD